MNNVEKFSKILTNMKELMGGKDWVSAIDTSLLTYTKDLNALLELLKNNTFTNKNSIDLNNKDDIDQIILKLNAKSTKPGKIKQRLNFYQLFGILDKRNEKYLFTEDSIVNFSDNNIPITFINNSIKLFKLYMCTDKNRKKFLKPSLRIFIGFYIFCLQKNLEEKNLLENILKNVSATVSDKIYKLKKLEVPEKSDACFPTTYTDFYNTYFAKIIKLNDLEWKCDMKSSYLYCFIDMNMKHLYQVRKDPLYLQMKYSLIFIIKIYSIMRI